MSVPVNQEYEKEHVEYLKAKSSNELSLSSDVLNDRGAYVWWLLAKSNDCLLYTSDAADE